MAVHKISADIVKIDADTITEVKNYSIEENAATIETTSRGDTWRTYVRRLPSCIRTNE